ncbi:hypothetical protein PR202_gb27608 [Eleusine coracana subsp. coracana]|uniref:RING-type E3 ubiquitin transferase n=1 Tax=Eleusine coracana subsp. coracana TaxID=191504 RepID=A0AAV5FUM1_ELECO|nr:hypothetical protein PR202_gb27608 [Eleusine coracana subsp. coracana]
MPLKLTLLVLPPLCICCVILHVAGVPWNITGRIAAVLVAFLVVIGIWDQLMRRRAAHAEQEEEPSPDRNMAAPACGEVAFGLEASAIAGLPVYRYEQKRDGGAVADECAVCLGEMRPKEVVKRLPVCTHLFHEGCIDVWLRSHRTCPVCRTPVDVGEAVPATVVEPDDRTHAN